MIGIVDYDMANLRSVQKAFERVGHEARIIREPEEIDRMDKIVLPGVGAFADAVVTLRERHLAEPIINHIRTGRLFLGICLGLQMLFEIGYEDGEHRGLGVLAGTCQRLDGDRTKGLKIPHMGWNELHFVRPSPIFRDLDEGSAVYFVHSYHVAPVDAKVIASTTDYGEPFVSSIWRDNLMATQFHPEKSQRVGLQMLQNFAEL